MTSLMMYYVLVVETFSVTKLGPFFDEKEVDDEAKKFFQDLIAKSPKRAQNVRSMLLCEVLRDHFDVQLYEPKFLLELVGNASTKPELDPKRSAGNH